MGRLACLTTTNGIGAEHSVSCRQQKTTMENTSAISDMWTELQASNRLPKTPLLTGCATELQELMHQIDVMISQKRIAWEQEKAALQAKNETRKEEIIVIKATLQSKQQEVNELRTRLEGLGGDTQHDLNLEYERQLQSLRQEVAQMKEDYDRHHRKCARHVKETQKEKAKAVTEVNELSEQLTRLKEKLEDYRHSFHEVSNQNTSYQKEVEALRSLMKTSTEKYDLSQQQLGSFQLQVDKRRDLLEMTEINLKSKIANLEGQLSRTRDTINSQDSQIARLKASLDSALSSQKRALAEKEALEREMLKSQRNVRRLENEKGDVCTASAIKDEHLQAWKSEQELLVQQISELQHSLTDRDRLVQNLEKSHKVENADVIRRLREEAHELRADLKATHKNEQRLKEEKRHLEAELDTARQDCVTLNEELTARVNEVRRLEGTDLKKFKLEIAKLQERLAVSEERRVSEVRVLRSEATRVLTELHDRDLTVASLSERSSSSEQQLREQFEQLENTIAELHIANAELQALRAENRNLRLMTLGGLGSSPGGSTSMDLNTSDAQQQISELRDSYSVSVKTLEKQNDQLTSEVGRLREQLRVAENDTRRQVEGLLREKEKAVDRGKQEEAKRIQDVRESCDREADALRNKLCTTVSEYESQIDKLRYQVAEYRTNAEAQSKMAERLGLENEVMTHFVNGVDQIVQCPPHREGVERPLVEGDYASGDASRLSAMTPSCSHDDTNDDIYTEDTYDCADSVMKHFLDEQKQWTEVLEQQLDSHINDLKASSDTILQKYITNAIGNWPYHGLVTGRRCLYVVISRDIDILALTETWLDSVIDDHVISELVPRGYGFHAVSRPGGQRGGEVAVLYKSGLTLKTTSTRGIAALSKVEACVAEVADWVERNQLK
ncbi:Deuterosome assembly protein 1 [Lamellibrachia satsuma]|nr:Deuterosome assembly protein 1 [Lamellibrachia satsuma]